jgi:hypothetical protein
LLIEPRDQILDIWRSTVAYSFRGGSWSWGARSARNSISDAEQLLCILYPATIIPALGFDEPDRTPEDILLALRKLGNELEIAKSMISLLNDYLETYQDENDRPIFGGGSYLEPESPDQEDGAPTGPQRAMEIVDAYSMSITLSLATLGFLQVLSEGVRNPGTLAQISHVRGLASNRLTAAMTGLLRSFSVHVFEVDSEPGRNLLSMVNQAREPDRVVAERLSRSLDDIRGRLRLELSVGSGQVAEQLDNRACLFECGWSWGVVKDAAEIAYAADVAAQPVGVAEDRPYLYFTSVALDCIEDLFSARTQILGLLDETQQRLAQSLKLRFDLTLAFWNRVSTFGSHLPVEDVPWRTSDGDESDYFTLFVASMLVQQSANERNTSPVLLRMSQVFEDLARRGRITSRPTEGGDQALLLHHPGLRVSLVGSEELGPRQAWIVSSFSSLLLKRVIRLAGLLSETTQRDRMIELSDFLWGHLRQRRMGQGLAAGLWDQPSGALPVDAKYPEPSWYHTQRVVECLVVAAEVVATQLPASVALESQLYELLAEAEQVFNQEKLNGTPTLGHSIRVSFESIEKKLDRARRLARVRPGTAMTLTQDVLRELDSLSMARQGTGSISP